MEVEDAVQLALRLVRSRPLGRWPEELVTWEDLTPILTEAKLIEEPGTSKDLEAVRALRDRLVIPLLSSSDVEAADALNSLVKIYGLQPKLDERGVHHSGKDNKLDTNLAALLVPALMQGRARGLIKRIGVCADSACDTAFLDQTKAKRRRYCSPQCATRARVARHRERNV